MTNSIRVKPTLVTTWNGEPWSGCLLSGGMDQEKRRGAQKVSAMMNVTTTNMAMNNVAVTNMAMTNAAVTDMAVTNEDVGSQASGVVMN